MSAEVTVRAAVIAALRADGALMAQVNALFDGEPVRATAPYAVVGESVGAEWGGKGIESAEVRVTIALYDAGETPALLAGMMARVDPALGGAPVLEGWRIVTARLIRSRVARSSRQPGSGWQAVMDYRVRAVRD
ncbi:DUF3168 domain-containing protein [Sphingobium sp.]|uniref:DUF3168 domain-containing protein n=1 Tax=Sphingobium sp. TaxID=1912891 RepID=UPI003BB70170